MASAAQYREEIIIGMRSQGIEKTKKNLKKVEGVVKDLSGETARTTKDIRRNMLGMGLSFLFTGMAIKRFADNMLKGLVNTYKTVMGEGSKFQEQTNRLSAAFTFLKFSIFDALAQSDFFAALVEWLVGAANAIAEFVGENPKLAKGLAIFFGIASVVGGFMMIFGQATLGMLGFVAMAEIAKLKYGSLGKFIAGPVANMIAFGLIAAMVLVFAVWTNKLGGLQNFAAVVALGMISIFGIMGGFVVKIFENMLNVMLTVLNAIIDGINMVSRALGGGKVFDNIVVDLGVGNFGEGVAQQFFSQAAAGQYGGFLQGGAQALQGAQASDGNMGWMNPMSGQGGITNIFNINGSDAASQQELANTVAGIMNDESMLNNGAPGS